MKKLDNLHYLLTKFRQDACSPEELRMLEKLLNENEQQQSLEQLIEHDWESFDQAGNGLPARRAEAIFDKVISQEKEHPLPSFPSRRIGNWRLAAACILLVLCAGALLWWSLPGLLTETHQYATADIQEEILLPDGSRVRLNVHSRLTYQTAFFYPERKVTLAGEAYFQVARNEHKPFVLRASRARIQVLGTRFNVKENLRDSTVWVAVTEGKVAFSSVKNHQPAHLLTANQIAQLRPDGNIYTETGQVDNYLSWISGNRLQFQNTPLKEVARQLERLYGIPFELHDQAIGERLLTANTRFDSLPGIMEKIALSMQLRYRIDADKVVLMPE